MQTITLYDTAAILPQALRIHCRPNSEPIWDISSIEIYADPACTVLLADDIQIGQLPPSSQLSIYAGLNAWQHVQDELRWNRRRELAEVTRILEGAT